MLYEKQNCWEFKKCGRETTSDCPAVNNNAGKICWMVAGTMCGDQVQGSFTEKAGTCRKCDFYAYINQEF